LSRLKVLIAEDDPVSLRLMEASVTNWGHEAVSCQDGQQAKTLLRAGGFHLCILDWEIPKINGIDLCQWIRSARLTPEPYVIMLSSRKELEHAQAGYKAGVDSYMGKPFDRNVLRNRIFTIAERGLEDKGPAVQPPVLS
jgi:two-component system chemotaxis response regulator CheY